MKSLLEDYDKEFMKTAVLKQEEIFKEQVYELHRLYQTQKVLMNDMERKRLERPPASTRNSEIGISLSLANYNYREEQRLRSAIDQEHPTEDFINDYSGEAMSQSEQEIDIELRLGRGYNQMKKVETPSASDSGPSLSSSSTDSGAMQKSVGTFHSMNTTQMLMGHDWRLIQMPATKLSLQSEKESSFVVDEQLKRERAKRPPWLFHVMSW